MGFIECLCGDVNALLMFIYDKLLVPVMSKTYISVNTFIIFKIIQTVWIFLLVSWRILLQSPIPVSRIGRIISHILNNVPPNLQWVLISFSDNIQRINFLLLHVTPHFWQLTWSVRWFSEPFNLVDLVRKLTTIRKFLFLLLRWFLLSEVLIITWILC